MHYYDSVKKRRYRMYYSKYHGGVGKTIMHQLALHLLIVIKHTARWRCETQI
uniref:Uncharacterized protein n=1 Tax=Anguilla anguilla TaxID=7936 RepID=A0A0E9QGK3_ANGAN